MRATKRRFPTGEALRLCRRANALGRLRDRVRSDPAAKLVLAALLRGLSGTSQLIRATSLSPRDVNAARRRLWQHAASIRADVEAFYSD